MKVKVLKKLPKSKHKKVITAKRVAPVLENKQREQYLKFYDDVKIEGNGKNDW